MCVLDLYISDSVDPFYFLPPQKNYKYIPRTTKRSIISFLSLAVVFCKSNYVVERNRSVLRGLVFQIKLPFVLVRLGIQWEKLFGKLID